MFFADPALSFTNMRKALKPSGRLAFACWREPRENPFFMAPLMAAYKHVPKLPQQGPEDPGPFAFASEDRVRRILGAAGFTGIEMEPCPLALDAAIGGGLDGAVQSALEIGPVSRALEGHPPDLRAAVAQSIREALTPFAKGDAVPLPAAIWIVTARASRASVLIESELSSNSCFDAFSSREPVSTSLENALKILTPALPRSSPGARWSAPPFPCPAG